MKTVTFLQMAAIGILLGGLAACGGSGGSGGSGGGTTPATYTIGGSVAGLGSGDEVVLEDNGGDKLTVSANGAFTFATALSSGAAYAVTMLTAPTGETCTLSSASGTVASANVTSVAVACKTVPLYSIVAEINNLLGTISIQLNTNKPIDLTVGGSAPDPSFLSPLGEVASGSAYTVKVVAQPSGYTCTTTDGSGTVGSSNLTVTISCTSTGGGGGGGTGAGFWLPFAATPVSGTSGGTPGLFLIASNAIGGSTAPTMKFVTTSPPTLLGLAFQGFAGSTPAPSSITPALMIYAAIGADGNWHLYGLDLANPSNSSTPPSPTQITNLSVPASKAICSGGQLQANAVTPSSLSVIAYVATPETGTKPGQTGYCEGVPGGTYYLASYTDSAASAPTVVSIPGGTSTFSALENDGNFAALNLDTGVLGGVLYWDSVTQDENFYASASFTSSATLLSGVQATPFACVNVGAVTSGQGNSLAGSYLAAVKTAAGYSSYQFSAAGVAHEFFAGQASGCVTDAANLYFVGTPTSATTPTIYQESVASLTAPTTLLPLPAQTESAASSLIGSNGSVLILDTTSVSGGGSVTTTVLSLPVGLTSTTARSIGGPYAGSLVTDFLASPGAGSAADDVLFLSEANETISGGVTTVTYASQVLDPAGAGSTIVTSPNSVWASFGALSTELTGDVLQIKGISDTSGGYGGATLDLVSVGSLTAASTPLTAPGGASYTVPAGYAVSLSGFYGTTIASAALFSVKGAPSIAAAIDVAHHVIAPLSLSNTNITPLL